jgi:hypothetical protein
LDQSSYYQAAQSQSPQQGIFCTFRHYFQDQGGQNDGVHGHEKASDPKPKGAQSEQGYSVPPML